MANELVTYPEAIKAFMAPGQIPKNRADVTRECIKIILRQVRLIDQAEIGALLAEMDDEQSPYVRAFLDFRQEVDLLDMAAAV